MADGQGRATLDGNRATFTRLAQQERRPADERRARARPVRRLRVRHAAHIGEEARQHALAREQPVVGAKRLSLASEYGC